MKQIFLLIVAALLIFITGTYFLEQSRVDRLAAETQRYQAQANYALALGHQRLLGAEAFGLIVAYSLPLLLWFGAIATICLIAYAIHARHRPQRILYFIGTSHEVQRFLCGHRGYIIAKAEASSQLPDSLAPDILDLKGE